MPHKAASEVEVSETKNVMKKNHNPSETLEHLLGEAYWLMISLEEMRDRLNLLIENQQKLMKEIQAKLKS